VEEALHLVELDRCDGRAFPRGLHPEHVAAQWRERHEGADIHPEPLAVQAVQILRKRLPVPTHAELHGAQRDCLDTVHHPHVEITIPRPGRRKAEAALTDADRGDAEPAGQRRVRIPVELGVVVRVEIDRAWSDDATPRVDLLRASRLDAATHAGDAAVLDADVGLIARHTGTVDHRSATNDEIELGHAAFLPRLSWRFENPCDRMRNTRTRSPTRL
jgi:hypothetical protein